MSETVFFQESNILVTNARAVFGNQTFALANISSVRSEYTEDASAKGCVLWIGAILILAYGLGILLIILSFFIPPVRTYIVKLHTSGGELNAYSSKDQSQIQRIVHALNEAIIARG